MHIRSRGFTLIEVMVVLVILGITATAVTFSIGGLQARETEREVDRLRLVLEAAGERAATHGTPLEIEFLPGRYRFSLLDADGQWRPVPEGDPLAERLMPEGLEWRSLRVEGRKPDIDTPLVFGSEMPMFELELTVPAGSRHYASRPDGSVVLERQARPDPG